jgi:hypothetical protein
MQVGKGRIPFLLLMILIIPLILGWRPAFSQEIMIMLMIRIMSRKDVATVFASP